MDRRASGDHIAFQKITGPQFCQIGLYESRPTARTRDEEITFEWTNVVEKTFQADAIKELGKAKTRNSIPYAATSATVTDADDHSYYAILYVVTPPGVVSSVIALSNSGWP